MLRCSPEAGRSSRGQERRKIKTVFEMIGERVEGGLDLVLVGDLAGFGAGGREKRPAEGVTRK
jgi:hypothetical protein